MDAPNSPPSSKENGDDTVMSGPMDNADEPVNAPCVSTLPASTSGGSPSSAGSGGLNTDRMTRLSLNSKPPLNAEEPMRTVAVAVSTEILVGAPGSAGVVAATLRHASPVWTPPALATLIVELDEAVATASTSCDKNIQDVPAVVAAVASELAKGWDHTALALMADIIALHHGWGRGSDILHELLKVRIYPCFLCMIGPS